MWVWTRAVAVEVVDVEQREGDVFFVQGVEEGKGHRTKA